jgi:TrmH family RNA methyltransferase
MSNFGFSRLRVVKPYEASFREARSAVGASALLARAEEYQSVAEAVADCALVVGTSSARDRKLHQPLRSLPDGARLVRARLRTGRVALLFGSEKRGLSNQDFSHCHWLLRIPTREQHSSMNLGQAVAVCLYEVVRAVRRMPPPEKQKPATSGELERITALLLDTLHASGYVKPGAAAAMETRVRRMVRRLELPSSDAEIWLGMLRQILWKIRSS